MKRLQLPPRKLTAARLVVNEVRRVEWRVWNHPRANHSVALVTMAACGGEEGGARWRTADWCQKQRRRFVTPQILFQLAHLEKRDKANGTKTKTVTDTRPIKCAFKSQENLYLKVQLYEQKRGEIHEEWKERVREKACVFLPCNSRVRPETSSDLCRFKSRSRMNLA